MGNKSISYQSVLPTTEEQVYETKYIETEPSADWSYMMKQYY